METPNSPPFAVDRRGSREDDETNAHDPQPSSHPSAGDVSFSLMRAVLHDAEGPGFIRLLPLALLPVAFGVAALAPSTLIAHAAVFTVLMAPGIMPRFRPRSVEVRLGGGRIDVRGAGLRNQSISSREIVGASTARVDGGVALTLARRGRTSPTTLVFATEGEADRAREALAVGHGGFGEVGWPLVPSGNDRWGRTSRGIAMILGIAALVLGLVGAFSGREPMGVFGWLALVAAYLPAFVGVVGLAFRGVGQVLRLGEKGVVLAGHVRQNIPYGVVQGAIRRGDVFELGAGGYGIKAPCRVGTFAGPGVDDTELGVLHAQLEASVARAHGSGPRKEETHTRVDTLRRGHDSARDWLARVDLAASAMTQTGYRGGTIEKDDLWLLLRDPDASEDLRAAAGRVLVRVDTAGDARARVDDIVAAVREEGTQRRLRVAIFPELDPSGSELEQLEEDVRKRRLVAR